jgi:hypothetical protein
MDDLDISWIDKQNKLHNIDKNYCREPMESIAIHFIYINTKNYIEKISSDIIDLHNNIISKERILQIIQHNKSIHPSRYILMDIIVYNVDLEPNHIQEFVYSEMDPTKFFKTCPILDDIVIHPSIFIFHSLNAIYFIFQEIELIDNPVIKPILKIGKERDSKKTTKKVRIFESEKPKNKTKYFREKL